MVATINVGYNPTNIITVTVTDDEGNISNPLLYDDIYTKNDSHPPIAAKDPRFQQKMRYLDSKKDLLGLGGFNSVIGTAYGYDEPSSPPLPIYNELDTIKKIIIVSEKNNIETKSWAKTKIHTSLEVDLISIYSQLQTRELLAQAQLAQAQAQAQAEQAQAQIENLTELKTEAAALLETDVYLFRESSNDLTDDIVDENKNKKKPKEITNFSNTILDPFKRSFLSSNAKHFPEQTITLKFDESFLDGFLYFKNCTEVSSKLKSREPSSNTEIKCNYTYDYYIHYSDGTAVNGTAVNGTTIVGEILYPNNDDPLNVINQYVIGNETKRLQIKSTSNNGDTAFKKHIIHLKEMGDLLQIFTMLVWMMIKANNISSGNEYKYNIILDILKNSFLMTTGDSIVFILCIMFRLPCLLLEFKDESDPNSPVPLKNNGRTRYFQRYRPANLSLYEKKQLILKDILNHNNKIIVLINNINIINDNKKVYISKSENPIYLDNDFLHELVRIIEYLNNCASDVVNSNDNYKLDFNDCPDFRISTTANTSDNTDISSDNTGNNTDIGSPVNDTVLRIINERLINENDYLKKLEMFLKLNCKIGELFYKNNNGNIYCMSAQKTLTSCKTIGSKCYFACNKNNYKTNRGSKPFQILCQENKRSLRGGGMIKNSIIKTSILKQIPDKIIDDADFIIDVNEYEIDMHQILLGDLYDNLKMQIKNYNERNRDNELNTQIDGYDLYSIYSLLAHDYDILNQVFYPRDKINEIPEDIVSIYNSTNIYMDNFTQYYINEIAKSLINLDYNDREYVLFNNKRISSRQGSSRQGSPREGSSRQGNPREGSPREGSPREGSPRERNQIEATREYERDERDDRIDNDNDAEIQKRSQAIKYVTDELFTDIISETNSMVIEEDDNNVKYASMYVPNSVASLWRILSPSSSQVHGGNNTRKNKRKQPKKYKSYNRKSKSKKHNKSKNKRKPNKTQRKPNKTQRKHK